MKGFVGGIPVALLAVAAQAQFEQQNGGTAIGGPSGNVGNAGNVGHVGHVGHHGGTAIGGPSGNDNDGGFISPYSATIKTNTQVNEWNKDDHSIKLKHTDVYPRPHVVPVPFGHPGAVGGPQVPGMGPFGKRGFPGGHSFPGGTAIGGPSGNDEGQSFDMSVTGIFNTQTNEFNKDDHSMDIKNKHIHPVAVVHPPPHPHGPPHGAAYGPHRPTGFFEAPPDGFAKRFVPPGGTAIGGPSGNDGGQSFSAPTNVGINTGTHEHNEDDHSIELEREEIFPDVPLFNPFHRRSENFGPPGHGGPPHGGHFEPHSEPHYAPHTETHFAPHPEPHYVNHPEPHFVNHPEPHYAPHYSPSYEPHYEPHTTLEQEITSLKHNNNGPSAGSIKFGKRGFPGGFPGGPGGPPHGGHFEPHPEPHYEPHTESHFAPHPEPHYVNHPEPHFVNHPEPHYEPHYSPSYEPHYEPHTTFDYDLTSVRNNNNGPAAGSIKFGKRGFPGGFPGGPGGPPHGGHFEPHPEPHYAPHTESHFEPHPEPHYVNHPEPHFEHHPEPHYEPHYNPYYEPHYEPHTTFDYELTALEHNNNGPAAGSISFGKRAFAPTGPPGGTAIGGPSGDDASTGFSLPTNIGVDTGIGEHNEDNHSIEGEFTHVHPPASADYDDGDYEDRVEAQCAAPAHEVVHTVTKTQYKTAEATQMAYQPAVMESNDIPVHTPQQSAGADPMVSDYEDSPSHSPQDYAGTDPMVSDYDDSPSHSPQNSAGADPMVNAYDNSPSHSPQNAAGADPMAKTYGSSAPAPYSHASHRPMSKAAAYSMIPVHVPMATPASHGAFATATPSSSMGKMVPSGVSGEHKAYPSSSASASASHGIMFQGGAARLSGGIVSAAAAVVGVLAFIL
ncbi:uncharacterized protein PGRI_039480 [Penicillium griseofulvum]|uniref:GPI anchored protein n=1 Tax=Penicillium patulum TaxID=5078 RepID=A0A135LCK1_PENPA|nr:uncharacterized protein PGRI_039480 [Penicillium griseofulvum]KXG46697.1 hypothetical protein PGRI_039480 [Penicillium griseofulvum]